MKQVVYTLSVKNRVTHLYPPHNISSVYLTTTNVQRSGRITNGMRSGRTIPHASAFSSPTPEPTTPGMTIPRTAWVGHNRLRIGVGRFRSCLYKWGMASSAACECGAEEQTVDHVVLQCPIHRPPHAGKDLRIGQIGHGLGPRAIISYDDSILTKNLRNYAEA